MFAFFGFFITLGLLYLMGKLVYPTATHKHIVFVKILAHFVLLLVASALTMLGIIALCILPLTLLASLAPESAAAAGKLPTGQILIIILVVILATALTHYMVRKKLLQKFSFLRLSDEEYIIFEYFIQWVTIYVVVYQFMFDGVVNLAKLIPEINASADAFSVILSPGNINMVLQPLLITTWILVVMEKLHFEKQPAPQAIKKTKNKR